MTAAVRVAFWRPMHASLPMYNLPEMRAANAAFWQAVRTEAARDGLAALPEHLDGSRKPVPARIDSMVVFTQVCGWPLRTIFAGQAAVLAVPCYDAPFCDGPAHAGVFVVARDSPATALSGLRGSRFLVNSQHSNSGMNLPRLALAALGVRAPFFASVTETGSQPLNLEAVAGGEADATAVDCVTLAFFTRHRPALAALLRVLAPTPPSPALPFVTSVDTPPEVRTVLAAALRRVGTAPEWASARAGLLLRDILPPEAADYAIPLRYASESTSLGYPLLA